jgi:hypothetical protein
MKYILVIRDEDGHETIVQNDMHKWLKESWYHLIALRKSLQKALDNAELVHRLQKAVDAKFSK